MNLNRIAKELLEEKRKHARTLAEQPAKHPPVKKTGNTAMTLPAPRLCGCGCLEPLVKKPNESYARFEARKYVSQLHADAHRTAARPKNSSENRQPAKLSPFNSATRLPDPRSLQTLRDNPRNESNMKRLPSLLEAERASGATHEPFTIEQFKGAARRAKRLHPKFVAMLRGEEVREPVVGEVVV